MKKLPQLPRDLIDAYSSRRGVKTRIANILNKEFAKTKRGKKYQLLKTLIKYHCDFDLRILTPDKICELVGEVRKIYPDLERQSYKALCKSLAKGFSFSSAMAWMKSFKRMPIIYSSVRFCPYCNADTVYAIKVNGRHVRSDLDHFFPKDKYPFLATSLYNLIPSCSRCNSPIKYNRDIDQDSMSMPYADDVDDNAHFDLIIRDMGGFGGDCSSGAYGVRCFPSTRGVGSTKAVAFVRFFGLEKLYANIFVPEICDLMRRIRLSASLYPLTLIQKRIGVFSLLWHDIPIARDINLCRLGKFKRDILKQFGVSCC